MKAHVVKKINELHYSKHIYIYIYNYLLLVWRHLSKIFDGERLLKIVKIPAYKLWVANTAWNTAYH